MKKQNGFVSTEIGIAIFVVGMLGLAGFLGAQFLVQDSNSSILVSQSQDTIKNIRSKYRYQGDFTGLSATQVIVLRAAPKTMVNGTDKLINSYGGEVDFDPIGCAASADCFQQTQSNLPFDACISFANGMLEISDTIKVGSTDIKGSDDYKIDQTALSKACVASGNQIVTTHTRS